MGAELVDKDSGWLAFVKRAREIGKGSYAKVGVLADTEKGGLHVEGGELTVAEIAAVLEFGTEDGHIPARSFVRATFDESVPELRELSERLVEKIIDGAQTVRGALSVMGLWLAAAVKKRVTTGDHVPPPNAPSTVAAKGSDRPLVDTGRMVNAITYVVVEEGGAGGGESVGGGE